MKTTGGIVFMSIIFLVIGILLTAWYFKTQRVCYDLPKHGSPDYWGPKYWKALHSTVEKIPCSLCREEAIEMISFIHDRVNLKLEKKLNDEKNFSKWLDKIAEIKSKYESK